MLNPLVGLLKTRTDIETQINPNAIKAIHDLCVKRDGKCKGCQFSLVKLIGDEAGLGCCVFGNCPSSWDCEKLMEEWGLE